MTDHLAQDLSEARGRDSDTARPVESSSASNPNTADVHSTEQGSQAQQSFEESLQHPGVLQHLRSILAAGVKKKIASLPPDAKLLMDTGCGYDLISMILAEAFKEALVTNPSPVSLHTANATTFSDKLLSMFVPQLNETTEAIVLPDTPWVLSIGRRCMEFGFGFYWPPYKPPVLVLPDGGIIELEVEGYIPYLTGNTWPTYDESCALPTVMDSSDLPVAVTTAIGASRPNSSTEEADKPTEGQRLLCPTCNKTV